MKIGKEQEGRLKGLLSFFIHENELMYFSDNIKKWKTEYPDIGLVYVTVDDMNKCLHFISEISEEYFVTVESSICHNYIPNFVDHFILSFKSEDFLNLRKTDTVKLYSKDNHVACSTLETMILTNPIDFNGDILL